MLWGRYPPEAVLRNKVLFVISGVCTSEFRYDSVSEFAHGNCVVFLPVGFAVL